MKKYFIITLLFLIMACATSEEFIRPGTDLKKYKRIAVLPLADYPRQLDSGLQVADLISMRLLTSSLTIVDRSQAMQILVEQAYQIGIVDENTAPQIGKFLGVQAILTGSINEWQSTEINIQVVQGAAPAMMPISTAGVSLKLIDIETGQIVWAGSARGSNGGLNMQIEAAKKAVNKLIKQFTARVQ